MLRPRPELRRTTVRIKRTNEEGGDGEERKPRVKEESLLSGTYTSVLRIVLSSKRSFTEFPMPMSLKISPKKMSPKKQANSTISHGSKSATELFVRNMFARSLSHPPSYATRSGAPTVKIESGWLDSESDVSMNGGTLEDTLCNSGQEFGSKLRIDPVPFSQRLGLESPHPYSSSSLDPTRQFLPTSYLLTVPNPSTDTLLSSRAAAVFPKQPQDAPTPTSMVNQVTEPMPKKQNQGRERDVGNSGKHITNTTISQSQPQASSSASAPPLANMTTAIPHTAQQSSSSSPLAKRKRTPDDTVSPAPHGEVKSEKRAKTSEGYKRHSVFWADDGNIFVQIAETRFKLYRGHLAKHSEWFRAAFDLGSAVDGPEGEATLDIQPDEIIVLDKLGVSVKDFEYLLGALDESMYVFL